MSTLEPGILKVLRKAEKKEPEIELSVFTIAEKIDARAGWVARALNELAKEGKVIRTRDGDEDGRGPFYRLLTLDTVPIEPTPISDKEPDICTITAGPVLPIHTQVSYTVPPLDVVGLRARSPSTPTPMGLLSAIESYAREAGFTVKYVEFLDDVITLNLVRPAGKA